MDARAVVLVLCLPAAFVLPVAVRRTYYWYDEPASPEAWLAAVAVVVTIAVLECGFRFAGDMWEEEMRRRPPDRPAPTPSPVDLLRWAVVVEIQVVTLMMYATTMDGGTIFAVTRHVYLTYAVPALGIAVARWKAWSAVELLYLRWGWAAVLAVGVPVSRPLLLAAGWVRGPLG
jgi:hypothetical protein